jgi:hypothetical protein
MNEIQTEREIFSNLSTVPWGLFEWRLNSTNKLSVLEFRPVFQRVSESIEDGRINQNHDFCDDTQLLSPPFVENMGHNGQRIILY